MWIMTNKGFISIVADREKKDNLLVRARAPGHIEAIFDGYKSTETPDADYRYRASIPRFMVSQTMVDMTDDIKYTNFKNSVPDGPLHDAYMDVWTVMYRFQRWLLDQRIKRTVAKKKALKGDEAGYVKHGRGPIIKA